MITAQAIDVVLLLAGLAMTVMIFVISLGTAVYAIRNFDQSMEAVLLIVLCLVIGSISGWVFIAVMDEFVV